MVRADRASHRRSRAARHPGEQQIGILATALYGIGGSLLGGILGDILDLGSILGFLLSIGVAVALILVVDGTQRSRVA